jgi:hypothetical protein
MDTAGDYMEERVNDTPAVAWQLTGLFVFCYRVVPIFVGSIGCWRGMEEGAWSGQKIVDITNL